MINDAEWNVATSRRLMKALVWGEQLKDKNVNEDPELGKEFSGYSKYSWYSQGVVIQAREVVEAPQLTS